MNAWVSFSAARTGEWVNRSLISTLTGLSLEAWDELEIFLSFAISDAKLRMLMQNSKTKGDHDRRPRCKRSRLIRPESAGDKLWWEYEMHRPDTASYCTCTSVT